MTVDPDPRRTVVPDDVLLDGTQDARRLLTLWLVRRSAFATACMGVIIGILVAPGHDVEADLDAPSDVWDELLSLPLRGSRSRS